LEKIYGAKKGCEIGWGLVDLVSGISSESSQGQKRCDTTPNNTRYYFDLEKIAKETKKKKEKKREREREREREEAHGSSSMKKNRQPSVHLFMPSDFVRWRCERMERSTDFWERFSFFSLVLTKFLQIRALSPSRGTFFFSFFLFERERERGEKREREKRERERGEKSEERRERERGRRLKRNFTRTG